MIWSIAFVVVSGGTIVVALFGMFTLTYIFSLSGGRGVAGDGLRRGASAPTWTLEEASGAVVSSPPSNASLQLIIFTDHSLKSFPSVAEGIRQLIESDPTLEIVVLMRAASELAKPVLTILGLGEVPLVTGSPALYARYNVRVLPFMTFVDESGHARASSLVNETWQIERLWKLAKVDPRNDYTPREGTFQTRLATEKRG